MSCGDFNTYWEFLDNGQFFDAINCPYSDIMGPLVFGLFVYGGLSMALYIYTGNAVMPLILAVILAAVVVSQLPGLVAKIIVFLFIMGLGVLATLVVAKIKGVR